ncbi:hypothetical protein CERZMDRAFT_94310 [Cercospora zeae-maydis SCOH1-5]|uniref:Uncharacterized protein n=1 Tax=Cercospora zeae-maydis SCOH1-5 TaxID=717836 RepID=A0A6A6FR19_9PEZI|nr:hypothetical protein CERZMDRAFT_94310 [Cercospora zeae-maydis SCOH1-5]
MATVTFATSIEMPSKAKRSSCSSITGGFETCSKCSYRTARDCQACKGTMVVQRKGECSGCENCRRRSRKDSGVDFKDVSATSR